jgi:hypothetical protein
VASFFSLSIIGWISGLTPFTCCKRALVGAVIAYLTTTFALKAINAILINAVIASQIDKQEGINADNADSN